MAITIKHAKHDNIADWTQSDLDAQIAAGNFPPGTTLADIVLPSDWNNDHTVTGLGTMATQDANNISITGGSISNTTVSGYIPTTQKGVANGVATLDSSGQVPLSQIPPLGDLNYQGAWNASTNTPTLTSSVGTKGYYYVVSVAGTTNLNGITDWQIGDWAVYNGSVWQKIDNTDAVNSVNGKTGTVVLTYSDVGAANAPVNTNITSMTGVTGGITSPNYVGFNTSYATGLGIGQLGWDSTNNALAYGMANGNIVQHIGEDQYLYVKASSAITKGQVCMFTGSVGASGVLTAAPATGITDGSYIMGVAAESIALNGFGFVQTFGVITGVNTTGFADGDILWYNPSVTGGLTNTKPSAPNVKVQVAACNKGGSSTGGVITVRVNTGSTLGGTDSNAQITSPVNGQILTYDGTNAYWKNTTLNAGTGITTTPSATGVITVTNTAPDQTVAISGTSPISVTGTYPNFTVSMTQSSGSINGWLSSTDWTTFNGKQTAYTNLTTFGSLANATGWLYNNGTGTLSYSTPTASQVGAVPTTRSLTINGTAYDLSADRTWSVGTVTSVAALTLGTTGTDLSSSVATGTTTPVITLNVPTASATNRGALSSTDWTTFNNKAPSVTYTTNYVPYGQGTTTPALSANLQFTGSNLLIGQTYDQGTGSLQNTGTATINGNLVDKQLYLQGGNNLLTYSQAFATGGWTVGQTVVVNNVTTAPDGTNTAGTLTENSANNYHIISRGGTVITSIGVSTFSCYAKANTRTAFVMQINEGSNRYGVLFNLSTGAVVTTNTTGSPTITSNSIVSVGNGWYRCSVSCNVASTCDAIIALSNSTSPTWYLSVPTYTGDGTSNIYIWGAQLETGSVASAYTPTTTTTITTTNNISVPSGSITTSADSTFNTVKVGLGGGGVSTNMAVGYQALNASATGTGNVGLGYQALNPLTSGTSNVGVGYRSLFSLNSGSYNVAVGSNVLQNITSASQNTSVGMQSMGNTTTGGSNSGLGFGALNYNVSGSNNLAIGHSALYNNTTSGNLTAVGFQSLYNNTTNVATLGAISAGGTGYNGGASGGPLTVQASLSSGSTAVTYPTLSITVTSGVITSATLVTNGVGFKDTTTVLTVTSAAMVTAGFAAGGSGFTIPVATLASGTGSVAVGYQAGNSATTATNNTFLGYQAGQATIATTTGSNNTYLGYAAHGSAATNANEIVIGYQAVGNGSNTTTLGNTSTVGTYVYGALISPNNTVTVTTNAGTVPVSAKTNTFTNSSAAAMTITMALTGAVDGQMTIVRIYDFSAVAQTITWVNTENSTVTAPTTSNGSTTLPLTVGFMYNAATSKWRCIASA